MIGGFRKLGGYHFEGPCNKEDDMFSDHPTTPTTLYLGFCTHY